MPGPGLRIYEGDCRAVMRRLPAASMQTCVTSPPYFGLRDYGTGQWEGGVPDCDHRHETRHQAQGATSARIGRSNVEAQRNENFRDVCGRCGAVRVDRQIGLEATPEDFTETMVEVFREVRRVLRDDGTVWLNLGDSYNGYMANQRGTSLSGNNQHARPVFASGHGKRTRGLTAKDMIGVPWRVAFALQADGWVLRSDIIWSKPNPMPESVSDRPTKSHEYLFLLSKQARYFYDADAIREAHETADRAGDRRSYKPGSASSMNGGEHQEMRGSFAGLPLNEAGRNKRTVWNVATHSFPDAHFATFPTKLVEPCILAGSRPGDIVLDPFAGSGTTGVVSGWHGRDFVGIELKPDYAQMARDRIALEGRPGGPPSGHVAVAVMDGQMSFLE